ncbi:reverse transcriptase domain-containing protein [Tanacetum coccineum]
MGWGMPLEFFVWLPGVGYAPSFMFTSGVLLHRSIYSYLPKRKNFESGNPTPISEPIIAKSPPSLTPFEGGDFILEEIEACFANDSIPPGIDDTEFDLEGYICLIKEMLNKDPYSPLPPKDIKCEKLNSVKSLVDEPPELKLKDLPSHLEYAFLEGTNKLPVIIAKNLKDEEKERLIKVLKSHKQAIAWKLFDIKGIDPQFCTHKLLMGDDFKSAVQHQRRVNTKIHQVIKKEVVKLLDAGLIYPISDSPWVSPMHYVPKKGGITIVTNEDNELIPTRLVTGWRVCIDYRKLNDSTRKDHFPLPFMDQMLERLARNEYCCFLDGFFGYFQIPIDPQDQEKTNFTCPYGTFAYRRMPFGLCNAPGTFQRCMMAIFHDMIEETIEVFMDDFSVFGDSFSSCLSYLDKMLKRCEDINLVLNWEKCHFMVKEGIVLGCWEIDCKRLNTGSITVKSGSNRAENLAADHLSRLENPNQSDPEKKEITKIFPLETLGMRHRTLYGPVLLLTSSRGNKSILVPFNYLSKIGLKRMRSPLMMPEYVCRHLKSLFTDFGTSLIAIIMIAVLNFAKTNIAKASCLNLRRLTTDFLPTAIHPQTRWVMEVSQIVSSIKLS